MVLKQCILKREWQGVACLNIMFKQGVAFLNILFVCCVVCMCIGASACFCICACASACVAFMC